MHPLGGGEFHYTPRTLKSDKILLKANLNLENVTFLLQLLLEEFHKDRHMVPAAIRQPGSGPQSDRA